MKEGSRFSFSCDSFGNRNDNSTSRLGKDNNIISNNIKNLIRCPICKNISLSVAAVKCAGCCVFHICHGR